MIGGRYASRRVSCVVDIFMCDKVKSNNRFLKRSTMKLAGTPIPVRIVDMSDDLRESVHDAVTANRWRRRFRKVGWNVNRQNVREVEGT